MKRLISIILVIIMLGSLGFTVAAAPTDSFVHNDTASGATDSGLTQEMYNASKVITAGSLGLEKTLSGMTDICIDANNNVYVLVSNWSQVVILNSDYTLNKVLKVVDAEGNNISFMGASGLFVDKDGKIYICDTNNQRILITDFDGNLIETWGEPKSDLIPEDFYYQPCKIVRTDKGYTYILSLGCYYGALLYSPENEFLGFYGANTVKSSALDTLEYLWNRLTQTDTKKAYSVKKLPYSFVDLCLDSDGYVVTCNGSVEEGTNGTGQIRKLSPNGENIMNKRKTDGTSVSANDVNFVEDKYVSYYGVKRFQSITSVDVDENNFIYAADRQIGFIYVYDEECNLLAGFGGGSDRMTYKGLFDTPTALSIHQNNILVADGDTNAITVFELTEYGRLLMDAQLTYIKGEYAEGKALWEKVRDHNQSCQLAYRGLAIAYLSEGDYENALECAEKGLDYTVYDLAYKQIRNQYILDNFGWIAAIAVALIGGLITFFVIVKRKNIVLIKNIKVKTALAAPIHPFGAFDDVKYKKRGSVIIALVILVLYYFASVLKETASGFMATNTDIHKYNTLFTLAETVGLVLLWAVANWLIASSFAGKGNFKEVLIATTYSMIPLVLFTFVRVIISHVISLSGLAVVDAIGTVVLIYTFFLLSVAIMSIHEYDFFKFMGTGIVTILFMVLIVFVIFLVGVLLQQVGEFIVSIFQEIFYR